MNDMVLAPLPPSPSGLCDFAVQIITGQVKCRSEVGFFNAKALVAWIEDTDSHHTADTCTSAKAKDCVHAPSPMTADWAATVTSEAMFTCTCGEHGVDNPAEAARVVAEFRARWNQPNTRPPKVKR